MSSNNSTIHVAASELLRLAPDALRGLGFCYPLADRAASVLVWGEAVHGLSLRFLADNGPQIEVATRHGYSLVESGAGTLACDELDAKGKCLLEAGPRALDLAQSRMASGEAGITLLTNTLGGFLAGELVTRAMARGRAVLIVLRAGAGDSLYEGDGLLCGIPTANGPLILAAGLEALSRTGAADLASALGLGGPAAAVAGDALRRFAEASADAAPRLALLVCRASAAHGAQLAEQFAAAPVTGAPSWRGVSDFERRQSQALRHGLEVDAEAWSVLGHYIQRTRIQTSERSRTQAG